MSYWKKACVILCLMLASLVTFFRVSAATETSAGSMTEQSLEFYHQGKVNEAITLQSQALARHPSSWLVHAAMSYMMWQMGNKADAITQGERAAQLAPDDAVVSINVGLMQQAACDYDDAIASFCKATRIDPACAVPQVGKARCYIMKGEEAKGLKILSDMSSKAGASFDWYYYAGLTCLKIDRLELAEKLLSSALDSAATQDQRFAARNSLLLLQLRSNHLEQAKSLYKEVFETGHLKNHEIYVRAASALLPVSDAGAGKELLNCAAKNLSTLENSRTFFQLGIIFEEKAADQSETRMTWLENAQAAFSQAIALAPKESGYHVALANVLLRQGIIAETIAELEKAHALNKKDPLPAFLLARASSGGSLVKDFPNNIKLSKAQFVVGGLDCSCASYLLKLKGTIANIDGVAFVSVKGKKPPEGVVIYDPSSIPIDSLLSKAQTDYTHLLASAKPLPEAPAKPSGPLTLKVVAEEPVTSTDVLFQLSKESRYGPVPDFSESSVEHFNRFNDIQPTMPWSWADAIRPAQQSLSAY